jgi:hypothetical protein
MIHENTFLQVLQFSQYLNERANCKIKLLPFGPEPSVFSSAIKKIRIYKTIILCVVLYGCETWSLTLREEHRLRVFENRVLRGIFGPRRVEMKGEWRKLHNE